MTSLRGLSLPARAPHSTLEWKDGSYAAAAFPLYLMVDLSPTEAVQIAAHINHDAADYLGFERGELEEMGTVLDLAPEWNFSGKSLDDVFDYHVNKLNGGVTRDQNDHKWCPLAFLVVTSASWETEGFVFVGFDYSKEEEVLIDSCQANPEKIGGALISLRQGDEEFTDTRNYVAMLANGEPAHVRRD